MKTHLLIASAVLAATAIAPAIALAQQGATSPQTTGASASGSTADRTGMQATQTRAKLNSEDKKFLDEAHASGLKEIKSAQMAVQRSEGSDVRALATAIERDHRALNVQLVAAGAQANAGGQHGNMPGGNDHGMPSNNASSNSAYRAGSSSNNSAGGTGSSSDNSSRTGAFTQTGNSTGNASQTGQANQRSGSATQSGRPHDMANNYSTGATAVLAADTHMDGLVDVQGADFDEAYVDMVVTMHGASIEKFEAVANSEGHSQEVRTLAQQALPKLRQHAEMAESLAD